MHSRPNAQHSSFCASQQWVARPTLRDIVAWLILAYSYYGYIASYGLLNSYYHLDSKKSLI